MQCTTTRAAAAQEPHEPAAQLLPFLDFEILKGRGSGYWRVVRRLPTGDEIVASFRSKRLALTFVETAQEHGLTVAMGMSR